MSTLRKESTNSTSPNHLVSCVEKEKERALSELRRITAEKEALREKLKVSSAGYSFLECKLLSIGGS